MHGATIKIKTVFLVLHYLKQCEFAGEMQQCTFSSAHSNDSVAAGRH